MTIYRYKTAPDHRVQVVDYGEHTVTYHRQGGGFQHKVSRLEFDALYEPAPEPTFRPGYATADFLPECTVLPCYSDGSLWNGFGMPYLTRESVDKLIAITAEQDGLYPLRWDGDKVVVKDDDFEGGEYALEPVIVDRVATWPVGAGNWTWDSITHIPTIEESVERIKSEVLKDMLDERVPRYNVQTFADLDDYVDINCYGGFCDDALFDAMIVHYGGRDEHEGLPQGMNDHIIKAQDAVDAWIRAGGHHE